MSIYEQPAAHQGWICPKCGTVWAPWQPCCTICGDNRTTFATGTSVVNPDVSWNAPTVGGWISVKDRLPDKAEKYLIARKGIVSHIDIACFLKNLHDNPQFECEYVPEVPGFYKGDGEFDWIVSDVTHWMPLPEPPEEEDDAE